MKNFEKESQVFRILLEQGCNDWIIKGSGNFTVLAWLLTGVVISNAYKGQNITDLSSPVPPTSIKTFNSLLERNFRLFSETHLLPEISMLAIASRLEAHKPIIP